MITTGKVFRFNSPINWEHGSGAVGVINQDTESTFEFFTERGDIPASGWGQIEWTYTADSKEPGVEHIGIWWTNHQLDDYDGVFDLPEQAVEFLESLSIKVGPDFVN